MEENNFNFEKLTRPELLALWYETNKELGKTNPFTETEKWVELNQKFDAIVKTYYENYDGIVRLEDEE